MWDICCVLVRWTSPSFGVSTSRKPLLKSKKRGIHFVIVSSIHRNTNRNRIYRSRTRLKDRNSSTPKYRRMSFKMPRVIPMTKIALIIRVKLVNRKMTSLYSHSRRVTKRRLWKNWEKNRWEKTRMNMRKGGKTP